MNDKDRGAWSKIEKTVWEVLEKHGEMYRTLKTGMSSNEAFKKLMSEIIAPMEATLQHYEDADYEGKWNDVDGGYKARLTLAKIHGLDTKKMEEDHANAW